MLYQVDPWDPATFVLAAGILVGIVLLAMVAPARSATHIAPTEAIRGG